MKQAVAKFSNLIDIPSATTSLPIYTVPSDSDSDTDSESDCSDTEYF